MTQKEETLQYLNHYKTITTWDAFKELNILRLGSVINELRNDGYAIKTNMLTVTKRNGKKAQIAEYSLIQKLTQQTLF
tara:strand:- start:2094 stop:2327 length:234 start_codon:yes stop_codon:yes gene_type:complete